VYSRSPVSTTGSSRIASNGFLMLRYFPLILNKLSDSCETSQ
jgi:hypothetical protein